MIPATMLFLATVSVVAYLAAHLVDGGLRRMEAPSRYAWLAAMGLGPGLLVLELLGIGAGGDTAGRLGAIPVIELPPLLVGPGAGGWPSLEAVGAGLWAASALGLVWVLARTHRTLLRERAGWESTRVLGRDVFVSADRGPAVAGMWDPWIVLPRWVLALPEAELRMVLAHEEEHLRARDTLLLASALTLVVLTAWNPVTWWQLRRLRAAMEVDCDRRVLRARPDTVTYGSSLLAVAARASGTSLGLAAFTERSLSLKQRILTMTAKTTRWTAAGGGVLVVVGLVVGVQACGVDSPMESQPTFSAREIPAPQPDPGIEADVADVADRPTVTPFTVAPNMTNREEVIAAMEAAYPPSLRNAGIGGTVRVHVFIDEEGRVGKTVLDESSGEAALDEAAMGVADLLRFTPALNEDQKVPVWVSFPITFSVR